jgi:hypothetical protein
MTIREYKVAEITEDTHNQYRFKDVNTQIEGTGAHIIISVTYHTHMETQELSSTDSVKLEIQTHTDRCKLN